MREGQWGVGGQAVSKRKAVRWVQVSSCLGMLHGSRAADSVGTCRGIRWGRSGGSSRAAAGWHQMGS